MKRIFPFLLLLLFPLIVRGEGGEQVQNFKMLSHTIALPYHYDGLWPVLGNPDRDYYTIRYDKRHYPLEMRYFGRRGKLQNNEDGWAVFKINYDEKGDVREASFFDADGKAAINKQLGFSKEVRRYVEKGVEQQFYDPYGKRMGIRYENHLRNKMSRPKLAEPILPVLEKTSAQK